MHALAQARRVLLGAQDVDVVGELAVAAQQRLQLALEFVLEVLKGRVVGVAAAAAARLEAGELVVRHGGGSLSAVWVVLGGGLMDTCLRVVEARGSRSRARRRMSYAASGRAVGEDA